eukprot:PLAT2464.1.p1 GENE.PLAT2464.1~~PLAT2464.1.p1  ORF type:complete len:709 (-),score=320.88 PLAT2464.1:39-2141(-)
MELSEVVMESDDEESSGAISPSDIPIASADEEKAGESLTFQPRRSKAGRKKSGDTSAAGERAPGKLMSMHKRKDMTLSVRNLRELDTGTSIRVYDYGWRYKFVELMAKPCSQMVTFVAVLIAIFYEDINVIAAGSDPQASDAASIVLFLLLLFFLAEITLFSLAMEGYFGGFYFMLDLAGSISLLPSINFLWPAEWDFFRANLAVARASRIARTTTRTLRLVRLGRLLRSLRLTRVVALFIRQLRRKSSKDSSGTQGSKLAERFAGRVSKRVVLGVILMVFLLPLLDVAVVDSGPAMSLTLLQAAYETSGRNAQAPVVQSMIDTVGSQLDLLSSVTVGNYTEVVMALPENAFSAVLKSDAYPDVTAVLDLTAPARELAWQSILLTLFIMFLFATGAYLFTKDGEAMLVQPIERINNVLRHLGGTLFSMDNHTSSAAEKSVSFMETMVRRMARLFLFEDAPGKRSTLFTEDGRVWTVQVSCAAGLGRLNYHELRAFSRSYRGRGGRTRGPSPEEMTTFLERLLRDPLAVQMLQKHLEQEFNQENLLFWQYVTLYHKQAGELAQLALHMAETFVKEGAPMQVNISSRVRKMVVKSLATGQLDPLLFNASEREIRTLIQTDLLPRFLAGPHFEQLVSLAKKEEENPVGALLQEVLLTYLPVAIDKRGYLETENPLLKAGAAEAARSTRPRVRYSIDRGRAWVS